MCTVYLYLFFTIIVIMVARTNRHEWWTRTNWNCIFRQATVKTCYSLLAPNRFLIISYDFIIAKQKKDTTFSAGQRIIQINEICANTQIHANKKKKEMETNCEPKNHGKLNENKGDQFLSTIYYTFLFSAHFSFEWRIVCSAQIFYSLFFWINSFSHQFICATLWFSYSYANGYEF